MIEFVECPEEGCDAPAEVYDRYTLLSTDGHIDHVRQRCLSGHVFNMPHTKRG